jgi:hemolysin D
MAQVDAARSQALLAGLAGRPAVFTPPAGLPSHVADNQRLLIASRLDELRSKVIALRQQAAEAEATGAGARAEVARLRDTLPFLADRAQRRQSLVDKGYASKIIQSEIDQQLVDHQRQIAVQTQNARRATASIAGVAAQIAEARAQATREVLADLSKAEADIRLAREEMTKADQKSRLQLVRAPVDGVVQQLAVYSEGAVLKPADPILVVVPSDAELVIEAQVLNRDIGFVKVGQPVTVKLEAYPFTRYGTLEGRLVRISRDAIQDEKLGPVYQARVAVDGRKPGGKLEEGIALAPGLQATAEIRTSDRRVIDYLLSPIERRLVEAGRER